MLLNDIKNVVLSCGEKVAISTNGESITYKALWKDSGKLANWLDVTLQGYDGPIVVYGHKNPLMLTCFFSCVKSGRAYCPVDISMPEERVKNIINAVNAPLILATEKLDIPDCRIIDPEQIVNIIKAEKTEIPESRWVKPEDIFYIIFTSGSTGRPKGVQITCENLNNFLKWSVNLGTDAAAKKGKVFVNQAPFSFDLSVMDLYTCLCSGGTLWSIPKTMQGNSQELIKYLSAGNINYWVSTPSFADMCLVDREFNNDNLPDMEAFLFCGETLSRETAQKLKDRFPEAKVINTYGPTESTVAVTQVEITDDMLKKNEPLPVGYVKSGTEITILAHGDFVKNGEKGEIVISGDTVSPGYFKDKEKTEKVFFTKRMSGEPLCHTRSQSYRTGDEGYIKDGLLHYCGRIDLQVKLHGYRIELGDIEANLTSIPEISAAVVIPKLDKPGKVKYLVGFAVCKEANCLDKRQLFEKGLDIKEKLKKKLPDYMIPKLIKFVDQIPMTNNGKADRKKLAESLLSQQAGGKECSY